MAFTDLSNSASISTTEYSLPNNSTTLTAQTTDCAVEGYIDLSAMVAGDQYELKVKCKINGGTIGIAAYAVFTGAQPQFYALPSFLFTQDWDVTMKRLAGSDRTIAWTFSKAG